MSRWRIAVAALLAVGLGMVAIGVWTSHPTGTPGGDSASPPAVAMSTERSEPAAQPRLQPPPQTADTNILRFIGLTLDTSATAPQACLAFSQRLAADPARHYEDYLRIDPAAKVSLKIDGNRLCIGGLGFEQHYAITIAPGLAGEGGAKTAASETVPVSFGEMPPHVGFADSGFILGRDQARGMPIETVNVEQVKVTVARIGDRILARTELGKSWQDMEGDWDPETRTTTSTIAVPVWSGVLSVRKRLNERVITGFPISDVLTPRKPGAYSIVIERARAPGESLARDPERFDQQNNQRWIFDTDLMLTSFAGQDGLHVFVRSLKTAKPVAEAEVSLIATNNDELSRVRTGEDGQAIFAAGLTRGTGPLAPRMLMAYLGDDFTAMEINRPSLDLSEQAVDGREDVQAVDAFLYTDRGIYRPGESIDLAALIRDRVGVALKPTPIALSLKRPDGVEAGHWRVDPNEAGGLVQVMPLSATAPRGTWRIEATLAGDKTLIGHATVQVQDFVPQRLKVEMTTAAKFLTPTEPARIAVNARYLFGAPAADLAVEGHLIFAPDPNPVAEKGWRFGAAGETVQSDPQDVVIPGTDSDGKATAVLDLSSAKPPETSVPIQATLTAAVVEPGGRTTENRITLPVHNLPWLIGLRPDGQTTGQGLQVQMRQTGRIEIAVFDPDGRRVARPRIDYRLIALNDHYNYYFENGNWRWKRSVNEQPIVLGQVAVGVEAPAAIQTPPLDWGRYRLEAIEPATGTVSSIMIYAGWRAPDAENPAPEKVALSVDGGPVKAGATAHIRIVPPFAGEMLVTVASSKVFESRTLSVPAEGRTIEITANADWGPGAYVVASLYRPQSAVQGHAPIRAVGVAWVPVDVTERTLGVAIAAPAVTRPRGRINVPVKITGAKDGEPVYVTLAAVDEGILQLTRFVSPDPDAYYFGKRRLAVDIRDDYAHLIDGDAAEAGDIRQGGDAGGAGLSVVPTRTVALYSGLVKTDGDGRAVIPLDLPDFAGGLRLMAVAFSRSGIGHGDAMMAVRDPLVGEISLPRFLAPKDQARMTLLVNNVDGPGGRYHVHIGATGSVNAQTVDEDLTLSAAEQKIETFPIAGGDPGIGQVALTMTGPDHLKIERSWPIQIRSPHFPLTLGTVAAQGPGETFKLDPALAKAFAPNTAKVTIGFSTLRGIDLPGLIAALDAYPYGCSEQLTSEALPLVYLETLKLATASGAPETQRLRVQDAINRLLEREDGNGVFGLWRLGDHDATPFLGAYVVDFLARAKVNGYAVPDEALDRAYKGMDTYQNGGDWRTAVFWMPVPRGYAHDPVLAGQAYADYVLARAKRADIGELRYLHDTSFERLEPVAKAQLGAALAIMGDMARSKHALDAAEHEVLQPRPAWDWAGDWYRTPLRDTAILLTLSAEIADQDRVFRLTEALEQQDARVDQLTTQEQAWLAVAGATLLSKGGQIAVSVNGADARPTTPPVMLRPDPGAVAAGYRVENQGKAQIFRAVTVTGVPVAAPSAMANLLALTKTVTTIDGKPVDLTKIRQNDRLVVHLSGRSQDDAYHQSILVDMLPAGWEIESIVPRGSAEVDNGFPWLGPITRTKIGEKRDDRFVAAIDLGAQRSRFSFVQEDDEDKSDPRTFNLAYVARAVTAGSFALPAANLQDMYRPPVMARTDAGAVVISGRE